MKVNELKGVWLERWGNVVRVARYIAFPHAIRLNCVHARDDWNQTVLLWAWWEFRRAVKDGFWHGRMASFLASRAVWDARARGAFGTGKEKRPGPSRGPFGSQAARHDAEQHPARRSPQAIDLSDWRENLSPRLKAIVDALERGESATAYVKGSGGTHYEALRALASLRRSWLAFNRTRQPQAT